MMGKLYTTNFTVLLLFLMSLLPVRTMSQGINIDRENIFFEVGGGYSQFFMESYIHEDRTNFDRTALSFMPNFRVGYLLNMSSKIRLQPFLGHNVFGGFSDQADLGFVDQPEVIYRDQFRIRSLEAGIMGNYSISKISLGLGTKVNYHVHFHQRTHYENHPLFDDGWVSSASFNSNFLRRWSMDYGFRLDYPLNDKLDIGTEAWFGIAELQKNNYPGNARQNHFRVLFRYVLK